MADPLDAIALEPTDFDAEVNRLIASDCPCCQMRGRMLRDMMPALHRELDSLSSGDDAAAFGRAFQRLLGQFILSYLQIWTPDLREKALQHLLKNVGLNCTLHVEKPGGRA